MRYGVPLFVFLFLIAPRACAQEPPPPAGLRAFFCSIEPKPATSWERWQRWKRPKKLFLPPPQFDYGMTQPLVTPSTPEDDPFAKHMKVYNSEVYFFGVSGARGFNLRNWPRSWPQIRQFLRLTNLLNFRKWLPQPESNALRMQNLVGVSFYFNF